MADVIYNMSAIAAQQRVNGPTNFAALTAKQKTVWNWGDVRPVYETTPRYAKRLAFEVSYKRPTKRTHKKGIRHG